MWLMWVSEECQAAKLQALGWTCCHGHVTLPHHAQYSVLLKWEGEGEPPKTDSGQKSKILPA